MPGADRTKFEKSGLNQIVETDATEVVLEDKRFQRLDLATKKRLLELLGVMGSWTHRTFDLVMTPAAVERINAANVETLYHDITVIEIKSTRKPIKDQSLSGFFFGATETEYMLADALKDRLRYAFVVLNHKNAFGRPFFVLLTKEQVDQRTRTKRVQFQVNFKSGMAPDGREQVFLSVPTLIAAEAAAELPPEER